MDFRIEQVFSAPRAEVEATFFDPEFIGRLGELPTIGEPRLLDQRDNDGRVVQRVHYRFTGQLNAVVRAAIDPNRLTWVEETVFDRSAHRADVRILPDHYPDRLRCRMTMDYVDEGESSRRRARGTVTVPMPLVGRKVERAIVSGLEEHAALEIGLVESFVGNRRR